MGKSWSIALAALATAFAFPASVAVAGSGFQLTTVPVERFATLPDGVRHPEGLAADPATGDVFVATFNPGGANFLLRIAHDGHVTAQNAFGGTPLLGLEVRAGKVYILNFGASKLQRVDTNFDASTTPEDVALFPSIGSPGSRSAANPDGSSDQIVFGSSGFPAPNAMVFDHDGNLYVSDSFQGAIFRIANATTCATPCAVQTFKHDPLLATAGFPPFGANGLAFTPDERTMFIANTGDNRVLMMDMASTNLAVLAESLHGADGLTYAAGKLWVATNQADRVVGLNANGRIVVRAGDFLGIRPDGSPEGLLFPASMAVVGDTMYVTNLALALLGSPAEPESDVTRWTISRFHLPR